MAGTSGGWLVRTGVEGATRCKSKQRQAKHTVDVYLAGVRRDKTGRPVEEYLAKHHQYQYQYQYQQQQQYHRRPSIPHTHTRRHTSSPLHPHAPLHFLLPVDCFYCTYCTYLVIVLDLRPPCIVPARARLPLPSTLCPPSAAPTNIAHLPPKQPLPTSSHSRLHSHPRPSPTTPSGRPTPDCHAKRFRLKRWSYCYTLRRPSVAARGCRGDAVPRGSHLPFRNRIHRDNTQLATFLYPSRTNISHFNRQYHSSIILARY
ncbi:hypothetical protein DM02DRAFT_137271 [Periconia macrospinosa]|uniref:Uncharacterized protein n=1 Tax=Periconia macrospinosa TaxID=97972 RepID=A0A2V1DCV2_9PLEO|nr:hypothetical protein DM02DRAFT_137271 [Periconia macrospinosa]